MGSWQLPHRSTTSERHTTTPAPEVEASVSGVEALDEKTTTLHEIKAITPSTTSETEGRHTPLHVPVGDGRGVHFPEEVQGTNIQPYGPDGNIFDTESDTRWACLTSPSKQAPGGFRRGTRRS